MLELQALEGKDVKDLLMNVGSGGGSAAAAAAPAAGGAAAGDAAAADAPEEKKKEEGTLLVDQVWVGRCWLTTIDHREGRVRRGHGFRSLRLSAGYRDGHGRIGRRCLHHVEAGDWKDRATRPSVEAVARFIPSVLHQSIRFKHTFMPRLLASKAKSHADTILKTVVLHTPGTMRDRQVEAANCHANYANTL